jgi:hypothetical protein
VGLIARVFEAAGKPTVTMSSARDITDRIKPPRVAFLNYPLGNAVGRPNEGQEQLMILRQALALLETATQPGSTVDLPFSWPEPGWAQTLRAQYEAEADIVKRQREESEFTAEAVHYAAQEAQNIGPLV